MRELKFRGKGIYDKKWVYGFYCRHDYGAQYQDKKLIKEACSVHDIWTAKGWVAVEESTIGQYTGLKDKNGVEIYEGDIVKFYDDIEDELINSEVVYYEDVCAFMTEAVCYEPLFFSPALEYEVIGNIHERKGI